MDRGDWQATVHGQSMELQKIWTQLSNRTTRPKHMFGLLAIHFLYANCLCFVSWNLSVFFFFSFFQKLGIFSMKFVVCHLILLCRCSSINGVV